MNILELELEDILWNAIDNWNHKELRKRGLPIFKDYSYRRQLILGAYGRTDIVGFRCRPKSEGIREIDVQIIELKKDQININTLMQAVRYAKGIHHALEKSNRDYYLNFSFILIGKSVESSSPFLYMTDFLENVRFFTYKASLEKGFEFHEELGYVLTDPQLHSSSDEVLSIIQENTLERNRNDRERLYIQRQGFDIIRAEEDVLF